MAYYLNTQTLEYPRHDGDLKLLGWIEGNELPENWVNVNFVDPPEVLDSQIAYETFPENVDGIWYMTWQIRDKKEEEFL
jgi:hypothetical protein